MYIRQQELQPLPPWDSERVFFSATQWFAGLLADVASATQTIYLQTYIFTLDTVGGPLLQSLCAAAERGVKVCLIVDGVGSAGALTVLQKKLAASNAQLHVYNPLPWAWVSSHLERNEKAFRFFRRLLRVNNRQHSKLCLIDNQQAWIGSFNITDDHIENNGRGMDWKDGGVRVTGARCELLREFFEAVWFDDEKKLSPRFLFHPITNFSAMLRKRRLRVILQSLYAAKKRIWIVSAYFSPVRRIVGALKKASRRGVDVCIMVPAYSDVAFFPALSSTYYADLLRAGVKIYEYETGILHAKWIIIDSGVMIGSSNMNHRSQLHDIELDVQIFSDEAIKSISDDFTNSVGGARQITLKNINRFYAWLLVVGQIPRLLRYWL
jgi:cardiolipin synthase